MKILVHTDSAFNTIFFNRWLKKEQFEVVGYFNNPNIHPYSEYNKQLLMQKLLAVLEDIIMVYPETYNFEEYLQRISGQKEQGERCKLCYRFVLESTAKYAKKLKVDYFTTSWLMDEKHDKELLKKIGAEIGEKLKIKFYFQDFVGEYSESEELAQNMNLYKPPYCGCIYSERYKFYPTTLAGKRRSPVKVKKAKGKAAKRV
jgi:epoxyqueuosine reductase